MGERASGMSWEVRHADCVEAMREMDEASVDAVVCDPPYGLEFMGKEWDRFQVNGEAWSDKRTASPDWNGRPQHRQSSAYPRATKKRCRTCGKQEFSGSPCRCDQPDWEVIASQPRQLRAYQSWCEAWATEALRVLKPGGHLLAFGGTRTYHRLACAVEDAGFEIRDSVIWLYGSGFPKSLDVGKAIDKAAGVEREVIGESPYNARRPNPPESIYAQSGHKADLTAPATPEAEKWNGWGTAMKPAHEPIVVARKPLLGTVAENCLTHGTGALNVDGCRIGTSGATTRSHQADYAESGWRTGHDIEELNAGRWPANVTLSHIPPDENGEGGCEAVGTRKVKSQAPIYRNDSEGQSPGWGSVNDRGAGTQIGHADEDGTETVIAYNCAPGCPVAELDRQSGELTSGSGDKRSSASHRWSGGWAGAERPQLYDGDTGGASRFFYTAKASRAERNAGLDGFEERDGAAIRPRTRRCNVCGSSAKEQGPNGRYPNCEHNDWAYAENQEARHKGALRNAHPT